MKCDSTCVLEKPKIVNSKDKRILKSDSESARNFHCGTFHSNPSVQISH
jgi:hypothetical protein